MCLPAQRAGTEEVAAVRGVHPPERTLPVIYECRGPVDVETIDLALSM